MTRREIARRAASTISHVGLDVSRMRSGATGVPRYVRDLREFNKRSGHETRAKLRDAYPILTDFAAQAGETRTQYFQQDLWAARLLYERRPEAHYDVGSRVDGFLLALLVFMPVTMIDVRPLEQLPEGLIFERADATDLPFESQSVHSISSLHAVEHFGLGRYGDPVSPDGTAQALREFARVLAVAGSLLLSVPIGRPRVMFNAHRVLSPSQVFEALDPLVCRSFSVVDDEGKFVVDADPLGYSDADYACGLFDMTRA